jgi:colanic acid biosynthesis glycosyl transferase WcaI
MVKRIIVQDYSGYPFPVQLSRKLAQRGHSILHLYAGHNRTPHGVLKKQATDAPTFNVQGLYTRQPLEKYAFVKRWFQEREYGRLVLEAVAKFKPDAVISADMPLDPQAMLQQHCRGNHIRFVFWLQDVISLATKKILEKKFFWAGRLIGDYYNGLEKRILLNSDHTVPITDGFEPFLYEAGIPQNKITVIPNWAPLDELPVLPKDNPWSREHGLADKFTFLYSGTLGLKHNPNLLLQIALHFKEDPQVMVFVGSEGPGADWLSQRVKEFNLPNLIVKGYQPMEIFPQVLAAGDVLIAILEAEAGAYSVPSKVLSYLAAQKPLLLAVPQNNLAARVVQNSQAGYVVEPADINDMLEKAGRLFANKTLREKFAQNARRYAEENFDIERIADCFEALL